MEQILIGRIEITDDLQFVIDIIQSQNPNIVVINLDEDNMQLKQCKSVLGGMELLPPPQCLMAAVDGDEQAYDYIYNMYYETDQSVNQYVTALIMALYKGKSILFYYPVLQGDEMQVITKFINIFWIRYGIGIGIARVVNGAYNYAFIPAWLKMMYFERLIGPMEFLAKYPIDAMIEDYVMTDLLEVIRPCCNSLDACKQYIINLCKHLKEKPNLKIPFHRA